ncbi:MAG: hypothetical protein QX191_08550, partial [Methylococcaceae bacterium]
DIVSVVEINTGGIAFIGQGVHGLTPMAVKKSLACSTWYGQSFFGRMRAMECGNYAVIFEPNPRTSPLNDIAA